MSALRAVLPVALALLLCGAVLLAVGVDPLAYYGIVLRRGLLTARGMQESLTRAAPLLLIAASLLVSFRAGLWNLGVDGQFLLAAVLVAAWCPLVDTAYGQTAALLAGVLIAPLAGAAWAAGGGAASGATVAVAPAHPASDPARNSRTISLVTPLPPLYAQAHYVAETASTTARKCLRK